MFRPFPKGNSLITREMNYRNLFEGREMAKDQIPFPTYFTCKLFLKTRL